MAIVDFDSGNDRHFKEGTLENIEKDIASLGNEISAWRFFLAYSLRFLYIDLHHHLLSTPGINEYQFEFKKSEYTVWIYVDIPKETINEIEDWLYKNQPVSLNFQITKGNGNGNS